jgi:hypothetical protein
MIQRIQSLFLLGAAACFGAACFMPIGALNGAEISYIYTPWVLKQALVNGLNVRETYYVGLLQVVLAGISFAAIFFYKNRALQMRICTAAIIIGFILLALMLWVYPDRVFAQMPLTQGLEVKYSLWSLLSILPVGLLYLANKFILRDEKKIRAADRLR